VFVSLPSLLFEHVVKVCIVAVVVIVAAAVVLVLVAVLVGAAVWCVMRLIVLGSGRCLELLRGWILSL
jgi:hypothetical protein